MSEISLNIGIDSFFGGGISDSDIDDSQGDFQSQGELSSGNSQGVDSQGVDNQGVDSQGVNSQGSLLSQGSLSPDDNVDEDLFEVPVNKTKAATVELVFPFAYGSVAQRLRTKQENGHTHRWTLYLRPLENLDTTKFIAKVDFKLHESFDVPVRTCESPPYEVTETGWGEFEAFIRVHLIDRTFAPRPINLPAHFLSLYNLTAPLMPDPDGVLPELPISYKPVIRENYDEIVLANPPVQLQAAVASAMNQPRRDWIAPYFDWKAKGSQQLAEIEVAHSVIRSMIAEKREQLDQVLREKEKLLKEMNQKGGRGKSARKVVVKIEIEDDDY